jgi:hypothetical protein
VQQHHIELAHQCKALLHNSQAVDNKNEFLRRFYNNFRLSQGQLKTYATTPQCNAIIRNY